MCRRKESTCRGVGESVSSSERASVEKSRRIERTEWDLRGREESVLRVVRIKNSAYIVISYLILINNKSYYPFNSK